MKQVDFQSMSLDDLWDLHKRVLAILEQRLDREKQKLESHLKELTGKSGGAKERRPYPQVKPKFRNPERPFETWAGRGRQPKWVGDLLAAGVRIDDLRITEGNRPQEITGQEAAALDSEGSKGPPKAAIKKIGAVR